MPHVDGMSLRSVWTSRGQSRFARPVAAVTAFARHAAGYAKTTLALWRNSTLFARPRKELDMRELEEHYARAGDVHDLERMERDWDRRDGGGVRNWDGR